MALILGMEYVVYGTADVENKGTITTGSGVTTYKDKESNKYENNKNNSKASGTAISSGSSVTRINCDEHISLTIYNDQGNNIYSDKRSPFGSDLDAYNASLKYMVKRTPFGSKSKN